MPEHGLFLRRVAFSRVAQIDFMVKPRVVHIVYIALFKKKRVHQRNAGRFVVKAADVHDLYANPLFHG